ncbi:MAG: hypothetical protein PHI40_06760, partial [Caldisericia bacterium]|nr:hypothetical protein [Caldisericia bacterium]
SVELVSSSTLVGLAEESTVPVQPDQGKVCYIAGVGQDRTVTFSNFIDDEGNPISITTGEMEGVFVILLWNMEHWVAYTFNTNIISSAESANFYYGYNIRKTYASVAAMNADSVNPIGTDGRLIKNGELVTVVNSTTPAENGYYSYEGSENGWLLQSGFSFEIVQITGTDINKAMSQKAVTDEMVQTFDRQGSLIMLNRGGINISDGTWVDLNTRVYSEKITGAVHIKVKEGYCIYTGTVFNSDGTRSSLAYNVNSTRTEVYFEIPEDKFARIVFAKTDTNLTITPNEEIVAEYEVDRNKNIIQGYSFINKYVKELYLTGLDPLKKYYVSSIASMHTGNATSIIIRTADVDNTLVSKFAVNTPQLPDSFVSLSPDNNSGISGYAFVEWEDFHQTLIINDVYKYPINEKVLDVLMQPIISSKLNTDELALKAGQTDLAQLAKDTFDRQGSLIMLNRGGINTNNGEWIDMSTRVYSEKITGAVYIKAKEGYLIYTCTVFNLDGTYSSMLFYASSTRTEVYFVIPEGKFARIVFAKTDTNLTIMPNEAIVAEYEVNREKNIVQGYSLINKYVKELYLIGLDPLKEYYVSSISSLEGVVNATSIVIRTADEDNTLVSQFRVESPQLPDSFVSLSPQNNSGISGYAVVEWEDFQQTLITNTEYKYPINEKVLDVLMQPIISAKLNTNADIEYLTLAPDDGVIHTAWNYYLKRNTIDNVEYIEFSNNLGETWDRAENIYGNIVYVHFFSNGRVLFATSKKCYYFDDISDIKESTLLEYDGTPFISTAVQEFFQNDQSRNEAMIVDGKEIVTWGAYSINDSNFVPRVWYSADFGETIKCSLNFNEMEINGAIRNTRHVHAALYNPYKERFMIITGDSANQCMVIDASYNPMGDDWSFNLLGMGDEWKFGDVRFGEQFAYFVTDYTVAGLKKGVLRAPYGKLDDYNSYEYVFKVEDSYTGALITILEDGNGNKLLFPDGAGMGKLWYCKNNLDFKSIPISESVVLTNVGGPNYNGEVYARKSQGAASYPFSLNPMVNLTKSMRDSGCTDFFVEKHILK